MKTANDDTITNKLNKLLEILREIQYTTEEFPCGGIGLNGPTQEELDEASILGNVVDGDPFFHSGQQIWLLAERAIKLIDEDYKPSV